MAKTLSPIVITSKKATDHLNDIKTQHADILKGMQDQSSRITQYKAEQESKKQTAEQEQKNAHAESQKMSLEAENKRMELENKRREIEIKAQALMD